MRRLLLLLTILICVSVSREVSAATTTATLTITPTLCVVDVIQDGTNQTVQTPSLQCTTALPNLVLPPAGGQTAPLFRLPFAGTNSVGEPLVRQAVNVPWAPLISNEKTQEVSNSSQAPIILLSSLAVGVIVVIGVDVALFEMRYSKHTVQWVRSRAGQRLAKK